MRLDKYMFIYIIHFFFFIEIKVNTLRLLMIYLELPLNLFARLLLKIQCKLLVLLKMFSILTC